MPNRFLMLPLAALCSSVSSSVAIAAPAVGGQTTQTSSSSAEVPPTDKVTVLGRKLDERRVAGSAHRIDAEALSDFEYDDLQRVLTRLPGVYVRDEDGFGLRPNIGLRGANSDRSSRVVLLEDGVLLGPAPYAAPAAYFTPLTTRMTGIEVFKGPASIRHGPFTVGGAIDLQTAQVPLGHAALADLSYGQFQSGKLHGRYGWGGEHFGVLLEGVRLTSEGFKELDGGGDTGFAKHEFMAKAHANSDPLGDVVHRLELKASYANERSNETYLGLTDEDFRATPNRRYFGSRLGLMDWWRTQVQARYTLTIGEDLHVEVTGYRHDFHREWLKLNRFRNLSGSASTSAESVLMDPSGQNALRLGLLRGTVGTVEFLQGETGYLGIGTNDRSFVSQGVQVDGEARWDLGSVAQRIRFGARLHFDQIERRHDEAPYEVVVLEGEPARLERAADVASTTRNTESAMALSAYVSDELTLFEDLILSPGLRLETVFTKSDRRSGLNPDQGEVTDSQVVFIPGLGAFYQLMPELGLLAGVHRGFSPVAPGQAPDTSPETSWNYELGGRGRFEGVDFEAIGFLSDYGNFLVTCTLSSGCPEDDLGLQFNAGSIWVYGLEASAGYDRPLGGGFEVGANATYTLTMSSFRTAFSSGSPQFQDVEEGDQLPYVPVHQANFGARLGAMAWGVPVDLLLSYTFVDRMRGDASQGEVPDAQRTDAQHVVDATLQATFFDLAKVYLRVDNLLNQRYIAARRPYGARPGKPFQLQVGMTFSYGRFL